MSSPLARPAHFTSAREAALYLLTDRPDLLNWKAGGFCGQMVVSETGSMTERQLSWMNLLLSRAGCPPLEGGEA